MSELKWVCSAKGGWAPLPPLSHKEIMQPYSGEGTPTISKLSSWEEKKKGSQSSCLFPPSQVVRYFVPQKCLSKHGGDLKKREVSPHLLTRSRAKAKANLCFKLQTSYSIKQLPQCGNKRGVLARPDVSLSFRCFFFPLFLPAAMTLA